MKRNTILLIKILIIFGVWCSLFIFHSRIINDILLDSSQTPLEKTGYIIRQLLGIEYQKRENMTSILPVREDYVTSDTPKNIESHIQNNINYQYAMKIAEEFNKNLDIEELNQSFIDLLNEQRQYLEWEPLYMGSHLVHGTRSRVIELSMHHYLDVKTLDGDDFRSLFAIDDASYRLGENLYELYMSANDIHLSTWQNPEILAQYLMDVLKNSILDEHYQSFASAYIQIRANASDYQVEYQPYVRLVAVLVLDTQ